MKPSKYNYTLPLPDGKMLLYNSASDGLLILQGELFGIFSDNSSSPEAIRGIHPAFYDKLLENLWNNPRI